MHSCTVGEPFAESTEGVIETNNAPASMPEPVSEASVSKLIFSSLQVQLQHLMLQRKEML